ncbi:MAG: hypothetical protein WAS24_03725 [Thermoplasmata archaeon]
MLDLFYNGILLSLFVIWLVGARSSRLWQLVSFARVHSYWLLIILWAIFLTFGAAYFLHFNQLTQIHDIPYAVNAAVVSEDSGVNPYVYNVVPRFETRYTQPLSWTFGPYNYLSLDLVVYWAFNEFTDFLGMPVWFVATNLLFSAVAFALLWKLLKSPLRYYVPIAGTVMLFYSFDNASLTLLLMASSLYLYQRLKTNSGSVAIIVMGLAVMTKIYAIIPFCVLVLYELQRWSCTRDLRLFLRTSMSVAASGIIATGLMLPFGIWHVIDAAVLFHSSVASRLGTSSGGTLLTQFPIGSAEFTVLGIVLVTAAMIASLRVKNLNDRMMLVSMVFLLVVVKSSQALVVLPGVFLPLKLLSLMGPKPLSGREASGSGSRIRMFLGLED